MIVKAKKIGKLPKTEPTPAKRVGLKDSMNTLMSKAELMLMGSTIQMNDTEDLEMNRKACTWYTCYLMSVINNNTPLDNIDTANNIWDTLQRHNKNTVMAITVNTIEKMNCITYCLKTGREKFPKIDSINGVFSYVYNITCEDCSEFGYTFYETHKVFGFHRVG